MRSQSIRVSIVTLAFLCGIAAFAAVAPPAVAQADDDQVNATVEYHLEPNDPDRIFVEATFENRDAIDEFYVPSDKLGDVVEEDVDGFEADGDDWVPVDDAVAGTIPYYIDVDSNAVSSTHRTYGEDGSWAVIRADEPTRYSHDVRYRHTTSDGVVSEHEDHVYLKDGLEVASAETEDADITVVGTPEEMAEPPREVAEVLADMTDEVEYGEPHDNMTAYAVPKLKDADGLAYHDYHFTETDNSVYDAGSTWFHEQVHVVDGTKQTSNFDWFTEGYADYGAALYGMQAGYQDFSQYRDHLESGSTDRVVLADNDWEGEQDYNQGARLLAALDYEIRETTDGSATIEDVIGELQAHDDDLSHEDFRDIVADVADEEVADDADTWATTTEPIFEDGLWDHEEHEAVFGPVPNYELRGATVTISGEDTERTLESDGEFKEWLTVRNGETVTVEFTVENTGGASGTTKPQIISNSFSVDGGAPVTLDPGESHTFTRTVQMEEDDYGGLSGPFGSLRIDSVSSDSVVVDTHRSDTDPSEPLLLENNEDVTVGGSFDDSPQYGNLTVKTLDGDIVAEEVLTTSSWTTTIDGDEFDRSTTYEVTFEYPDAEQNEARTQYVSTLDPIDGVVPVDRNGDGLHRDIDGDEDIDDGDAELFFQHMDDDAIVDHPEAYDFNGDGNIGFQDANELSADS